MAGDARHHRQEAELRKPSISIATVSQLYEKLDEYESDEDGTSRIVMEEMPVWPDEPQEHSVDWVAFQIMRDIVAGRKDPNEVYQGWMGARIALHYLERLAE